MTPYYDHGGITIYLGDSLEIAPRLEPVELLLTDPPYGIGYKGGGGGSIHSANRRKTERVEGDLQPFDPAPWLGYPNVALFGAQHFAARLPAGTLHVWDKRGDYKPVHTADFDTIWVNRSEPGRIVRCVWRGLCREVEHADRIIHPTQKPMKVVAWAMARFPDGLSVLDPYMGSGTTLRVAKDQGRRAIGIEMLERYCEATAKRLEQEALL